MSEATNPDVNQELVAPVEQEQSPQPAQETEVSSEPRPGSQEYNFREMRRILEEQQREIRQLREEQYSRPQPVQEPEEDELATMRNSDYLTVAQAKKLALQQAEQLLQQREIATQEERARLRYQDYDSVVSDENVQELIKDRDVAETLRNSPDPYAAAYKMIKNSVSYHTKQQVAQKRSFEGDRIAKNASKPVPSAAVQSKPIAEANNWAMNEAMRQELAKEMYECAKRK